MRAIANDKKFQASTFQRQCARAQLKLVCLIAMLLGLAACGTTSQELRFSPRQTGAFHLELPYLAVRANVVDETGKCFTGRGTNVSYFYRTFFDSAPGDAATIEIIQGGVAKRVTILIDVKRSSVGGTDVAYFGGSPFGIAPDLGDAVRSWATGTGKCRT